MPEALIPVVAKDKGCKFGGDRCTACKLDECVYEHTNYTEVKFLSPREEEILLLAAKEGLTTTEIANKLQISGQTVKNHLFRVRKFLGAKTIANAVYLRYVSKINSNQSKES